MTTLAVSRRLVRSRLSDSKNYATNKENVHTHIERLPAFCTFAFWEGDSPCRSPEASVISGDHENGANVETAKRGFFFLSSTSFSRYFVRRVFRLSAGFHRSVSRTDDFSYLKTSTSVRRHVVRATSDRSQSVFEYNDRNHNTAV